MWSYKIIGHKQAAEDLVQDFFIQVWNRRETLDFNPSFASYAYRSLYNASLNYLRDNEKFVYDATLMGIPNEEDADDEMEQELHLSLKKAIGELPDKCRQIFVMVTLDKKKHSEVAHQMGISVNTVKVQVSKAYRILRKKMGIFFFLG